MSKISEAKTRAFWRLWDFATKFRKTNGKCLNFRRTENFGDFWWWNLKIGEICKMMFLNLFFWEKVASECLLEPKLAKTRHSEQNLRHFRPYYISFQIFEFWICKNFRWSIYRKYWRFDVIKKFGICTHGNPPKFEKSRHESPNQRFWGAQWLPND